MPIDFNKCDKISSNWLELEGAKGRKGKYNESPYYDDIKPLLETREKLASTITDNYNDYKSLITQAKLNYNTIERHAGKGEYKYYFKRIDYTGSVRYIEGFGKILELQKELSRYESGELFNDKILKCSSFLHEITSSIKSEIEEHSLQIERARFEVGDARDEQYRAECYLEEGKKYTKSQFLGYLDQHDTLRQWEELKSAKGKDKALQEVHGNPQILGKLKGVSLGNLLVLSTDRARAQENLENLIEKLEKYEEYKERMPELEDRMGRGEFDKEILEKEMELKALEAKLPSWAAQEYVERAYIASKTSTFEIETNSKNSSDMESFESILSWAKDEKVSLVSSQYREIFEVSRKAQASGKTHDHVFMLEEKLDRACLKYIKERDALLARYEYSSSTSNASKLYRNISGTIDPDLAYDILKNINYVGISSRITKEGVDEMRAEFAILSDNLSDSRLQLIKDKVLVPVQHTISYDIDHVVILSKSEIKLHSLRKSIELNIKNIINNNYYNNAKKFTIDEYCKVAERAEEYMLEYLAINKEEPHTLLRQSIIARAIYEVENKKGWVLALERENERLASMGKEEESYTLSAGEKILIDRKADRIAAIESRLVAEPASEGKVINNHIIGREAERIEATREDRIKEVYKSNQNVKDIVKIDKEAAMYMAEHLVDYGLRYGEERLASMPEHYISLLKNISLEQSNATREVANEFDRANGIDHNSNIATKYKSKIFTNAIIDKDREGAIELAKHPIHKSITREAVISKVESIDVAKAQAIKNEHIKDSLHQLEVMQKEFKQARELEIRNNRELALIKSKGLDLGK